MFVGVTVPGAQPQRPDLQAPACGIWNLGQIYSAGKKYRDFPPDEMIINKAKFKERGAFQSGDDVHLKLDPSTGVLVITTPTVLIRMQHLPLNVPWVLMLIFGAAKSDVAFVGY